MNYLPCILNYLREVFYSVKKIFFFRERSDLKKPSACDFLRNFLAYIWFILKYLEHIFFGYFSCASLVVLAYEKMQWDTFFVFHCILCIVYRLEKQCKSSGSVTDSEDIFFTPQELLWSEFLLLRCKCLSEGLPPLLCRFSV